MPKIQFSKPPLDFDTQLRKLAATCQPSEKYELGELLLKCSYYRVKSYLQPLRDPQNGTFSVEHLKSVMAFDHDLRLLILDSLETVEVYFRTVINEYMSNATGDAFWYLNTDYFAKPDDHKALIGTVREEYARSREGFIVAYKKEYTMPPLSASHFAPDPSLPPSWMMIEICSFGFFSRLYKALKTTYRKGIAQVFSLDEQIVSSWFHALSVARNICAHHARIWNRTLGVTPKTPNRDELFAAGDSSKVSVILLILIRLLQTIEENSGRQKSVIAFITGSSEYFQRKMGFYPKHIHRLRQI